MNKFKRENIVELLRTNSLVIVKFTKKPKKGQLVGDERIMKCTLNMATVPEQFHPKGDGNKPVNEEVVNVFDVEAQGWRSFRMDSLIDVTVKNVFGNLNPVYVLDAFGNPIPDEVFPKLTSFSEHYHTEYKVEDFTCYDCANNQHCSFAWDLYNFNGDCLELN